MSETDSKFKQRIIGALVLIALAIIFLPMLFSSKDEHPLPTVEVQVPPKPVIAPVPEVAVEPVELPEPVDESLFEPVAEPELEFVLIENEPVEQPAAPVVETQRVTPEPVIEKPPVVEAPVVQPAKPAPAQPVAPAKPVTSTPAAPVASAPQRAEPGIDRSNLPVSWSIQLASLSSLANAERLRDTYRAKHYAAYVRSADGVHKVLIGPLIREAEAVAMCKQLKSRDKQDCFVVRYQP